MTRPGARAVVRFCEIRGILVGLYLYYLFGDQPIRRLRRVSLPRSVALHVRDLCYVPSPGGEMPKCYFIILDLDHRISVSPTSAGFLSRA
jgi:hypothetical protein